MPFARRIAEAQKNVSQHGPGQPDGVIASQVLAGKYRVECVLGAGGIGVVVAARHIGLDEKVAIELLLPEMLANTEAAERFDREARAAVKIKGAHLARAFDVGTLESGAPYVVQEFLQGEDLAAWLQRRWSLAYEDAVNFVKQATEGLAETLALSMLHRDLKPSNLFCIRGADGWPTIQVLDFGISKAVTGMSSVLGSKTQTNCVLGSPLYASSEQMQSAKSVESGTDVWALGVVLFELLTGRVPFDGGTHIKIAVKISVRAAPFLRMYRPDAPPGLEAVIVRCLDRNRDGRYADVAELALDLLAFAPKRAGASVERTTGIIRFAGLSAKALGAPASSLGAQGSETFARSAGSHGATVGHRPTYGGSRFRGDREWWAGAVFAASPLRADVRSDRGRADQSVPDCLFESTTLATAASIHGYRPAPTAVQVSSP
jgi:serine/threonine-protein kinase